MTKRTNSFTLSGVAFAISTADMADALAPVFGQKTYPWNEHIKEAIAKFPARSLEDAAYSVLNDAQPIAIRRMLENMLFVSRAKHDLFELADWLRDLDGVPAYFADDFKQHGVPAQVEAVMVSVLKTLGVDIPEPERPAPKKPRKVATDTVKPIKYTKSAKEDQGNDDPESNTVEQQDLVSAALVALRDKGISEKARWQRVNKAVWLILEQFGYEASTTGTGSDVDEKGRKVIAYYFVASDSAKPVRAASALKMSFAGQIVDIRDTGSAFHVTYAVKA